MNGRETERQRDRQRNTERECTYEPIGLNLVYDGVFPLAGVVDLAEVAQESERKRERESESSFYLRHDRGLNWVPACTCMVARP